VKMLKLYNLKGVEFDEFNKYLEKVQQISRNLGGQDSPQLHVWQMLSLIEADFPRGMLHILVVPLAEKPKAPATHAVALTRSEEREALDVLMPLPKTQVNIASTLVARWSRPVCAETVESLLCHLQRPLLEDEKIPIGQKDFDDLCADLPVQYASGALSAEQVSTLFRVSEDQHAKQVFVLCLYTIDYYFSQSHGTEDSYHGTYEVNISHLLKFILETATQTRSIRNNNENTSTGLMRPDYGLLLYGHCLLRGEEKGDSTSGDPKEELVDKLVHWTYEPLKYILGLLCCDSIAT